MSSVTLSPYSTKRCRREVGLNVAELPDEGRDPRQRAVSHRFVFIVAHGTWTPIFCFFAFSWRELEGGGGLRGNVTP